MKLFMALFGAMLISISIHAQELFIFSEPASNMPSKSVGFKLTSRFADNNYVDKINQRYTPEVMFGLNKNWMVHVSSSFSDFYTDNLRWESIKGYAKYRFLSNDDIHKHFRMAAFADAAYSRNDIIYHEMNLDGDNSGVQGGLIATQLVNKFAVSGTVSVMQAFGEFVADHHSTTGEPDNTTLNYSLSAGYLLLPRNYTDYNQVNLNLYMELLGMKGLGKGEYYLDWAPALQLIFKSTTKVNLGARFEAMGNSNRIARNNYFFERGDDVVECVR